MALTDLFTKFNGGTAPRRVYLTGTSMGGHVTLLGMHEFPTAFAGGAGDVPGRPGAVRLLHGRRRRGRSRSPECSSTTRRRSREDVAKMSEMLGEPPNYTREGPQLASVEIQLSGGPRPFAVEGLRGRFLQNISGGGARRQHNAVEPRGDQRGLHLQHRRRASGCRPIELNASGSPQGADMTIRSPTGPFDELVPFDGQIERPLLTMHGTGDLFVPIHLRAGARPCGQPRPARQICSSNVSTGLPVTAASARPNSRARSTISCSGCGTASSPKGDDVFGDLATPGERLPNPLRDGDPGGLSRRTGAARFATGDRRRAKAIGSRRRLRAARLRSSGTAALPPRDRRRSSSAPARSAIVRATLRTRS